MSRSERPGDASRIDSAPRLEPADVGAWRDWLDAHHADASGVWVAFLRKGAQVPGITYDDVVRQVLCFGWIDGTTRRLDDARTWQYCAPRKRGSGWARSNKERIAQLDAEGLLAPAGKAVIAAAQADGSWTMLDDVEALIVPSDLEAALASRSGAREAWEGFTASVRKQLLGHVATAKRPGTRQARVEAISDAAARGEALGQQRP
ncbi:YdeI family protein [Demequina sp. NBRC 110054]|uniref:YdeI/OmpD-associated family protein n=1 Tax=Demequina sp. NBRC 110054 TaxID=1570343 RepID=UPI000A018143|nr:YdeI/OmpD-associated family protein [Demequina sp. NBRC 110054]